MSKALNYLGIARMSGNLETGEDNAAALVKAGKARLLLVASDTSEGAKRRAEGYVFGFSTPLVELPFTKAEISGTVGKPGCSMVALRDLGLALSLTEALAAEDPERYGAAAALLREKREKIRTRKETKGRKNGKREES